MKRQTNARTKERIYRRKRKRAPNKPHLLQQVVAEMLLVVSSLVVAPLVASLLPLRALAVPLLNRANLPLLLLANADHSQTAFGSGDDLSAAAVAARPRDLPVAVLLLVVGVVALVFDHLSLCALLGRWVAVQVLTVVGAQTAVAGCAA